MVLTKPDHMLVHMTTTPPHHTCTHIHTSLTLHPQMDKEVNSLKAAMEQSKNDTVKYVLGLMLALLTAGLGAARLVLH